MRLPGIMRRQLYGEQEPREVSLSCAKRAVAIRLELYEESCNCVTRAVQRDLYEESCKKRAGLRIAYKSAATGIRNYIIRLIYK
jgi:hypothetical protein